jgi:hypothetical protein
LHLYNEGGKNTIVLFITQKNLREISIIFQKYNNQTFLSINATFQH